MPFPIELQNALLVYDNNKGFWRRFPLIGRDQGAIRALRKLRDTDQINLFKIRLCFFENPPKVTQESYKVYQAMKFNDFIERIIDTLCSAKLLNSKNLDKLIYLKASQFELFAGLLNHLNRCMLLKQENVDNIVKHFDIDENLSGKLSVIDNAITLLINNECLNQRNFNSVLEKPNLAANIASALIVLHQAKLLTSVNRRKLLDTKNQFLLGNEAHSSIWLPLETHLITLTNLNESELLLDNIFDLAQQENPAEKIKDYMCQLNYEAHTPRTRPRAYTNENKFSTVPNRSSKPNSMENLLDEQASSRDKLKTL